MNDTFKCSQCGGVLLHWMDDIMSETSTMCSTCGFHFLEKESLWDGPGDRPRGTDPVTSYTLDPGKGFCLITEVDGTQHFHPLGEAFGLDETLKACGSPVDPDRSYVTTFNPGTKAVEIVWGGGSPQKWDSRADDGTWP